MESHGTCSRVLGGEPYASCVARRARAKLAALVNCLMQVVCQGGSAGKIDRRNPRTRRQLVLGVLAKPSTRLLGLGQVIASQRRVSNVKSAAMALGYFLEGAKFPMRPFATRLIETAVRRLPLERLASYRVIA